MATVITTLKKVQTHLEGFASFSRKALLIGGGILGGSIYEAAGQEAAQQKLNAALETTGQKTELWSSTLADAASEIQALTTYADDAVLKIFTLGTNMGVSANQLRQVTEQAIGLATAIDMDVNTAIKNMILAYNGQFAMLGRYLPALREDISNTEKLRIVLDLANRGYKQAQAETNTFTGSLKQLKNILGDVGEVLGFIFIDQLTAITRTIKTHLPQIGEWIETHKRLIAILTVVGGALFAFGAVLPIIVKDIALLVTGLGYLLTAFKGLAVFIPKIFGGLALSQFGLIATAVVALTIQIVRFNTELTKLQVQLQTTSNGFKALYAASRQFDESTPVGKIGAKTARIAAIDQIIKEQEEELSRFSGKRMINPDFVFPQDMIDANVLTINKRLDKLRNMKGQAESELNALMDIERGKTATTMGKPDEEATNEINKMIASLKVEVETFGDSEKAAELYKLSLKGATEEQLKLAASLLDTKKARQDDIAAMELEATSQGILTDKIIALRREIDIMRDAEFNYELFDLQNLGATETQLRILNELFAERKAETASKALEDEATTIKESAMTDKERVDALLKRIDLLKEAGELTAAEATKAKESTLAGLKTEVFHAQFVGLTDLYRRIQESTATPDNTAVNAALKTANATTNTLAEVKNTNALLEKIANKPATSLSGVFSE